MDTVSKLLKESLIFLGDSKKAEQKNKYFKTQKGGYGEGDVFIGVSNPEVQKVCKHYESQIDLTEIGTLLKDEIHEVRFAALTLLIKRFKKLKTRASQEPYVRFYFQNLKYINNWDLVDCSCMYVLGPYFYKFDKTELKELAKSSSLWSQRVGVVTSYYFIKKQDFDYALWVCEYLIEHPHEMIQKAVGWMLKLCWQKGAENEVEDLLRKQVSKISRTSLRIAIEKMDEPLRQYFLRL